MRQHDHEPPSRLEIVAGDYEPFLGARRESALDFDGPEAVFRDFQQQVHFRARAGAVEQRNRLPGRRRNQALDDETLPTGARPGMAEQRLGRHMAKPAADQSFDSARHHPCIYGILCRICKDVGGADTDLPPDGRLHEFWLRVLDIKYFRRLPGGKFLNVLQLLLNNASSG